MFLSVGADPYCIVKCGRSKAETPVKKNTLNPNFSASVQFFVSNPGSAEVTVEVSDIGTLLSRCTTQCTRAYNEESLMHVHVCHDVCIISIMFQYCSYSNNYYSKINMHCIGTVMANREYCFC